MKLKIFLLSAFLCLIQNALRAQDKNSLYFSLETGMEFISCRPPEKDYIRGDVDPYAYDYVTTSLRALLYRNYFGIKAEKRILRNKLGISGGLRYNRMVSSIGKRTYWADTPDYFYLQFRQQGTTTEYLKIKELNQHSGYLGIPLELRVYPYEPRTFNVYYKVGADLNFRVSSHTDVVFYNSSMEPNQKEVAGIIEDPWPFYSALHMAVGFKLGKDSKPGVSLEICVPAGFFTPEKSGLVIPQAGGGLQFNVRIPF